MYLQEILEVAIGLVFMWLVLSITAMSFQEWIGNLFQWRAKDLERAIQQMLGSDELARQFYTNPLIANLYQAPKNPGKKARFPSYIPANKFALALFDMLMSMGKEASPIQALTAQIYAKLDSLDNPELQQLARDDWNGVVTAASQLNAASGGMDSLDSLKMKIQEYAGKYPEVQDVIENSMASLDGYYQQLLSEQQKTRPVDTPDQVSLRQLRLGLTTVDGKSSKLKESISTVLRSTEAYALQTQQSIATARVSVETWFNDSMERLTGAYKRKAQLASFVIGFFLALILNVDSIYVATSLWREPTLRQTIISEAQGYMQTNAAAPTAGDTSRSPLQTIPQMRDELQALTLPVGWTMSPVDTGGKSCYLIPFVRGTVWGVLSKDSQGTPVCKQIGNLPLDLAGWLTKLVGFAITGAATAQGAPFWFDILKKIINVRSSGANPDEKLPVG